jgi:hypothetical protein
LIAILGTIIQAFVLAMLNPAQDLLLCSSIARKLVANQHAWDLLTALEQLAKAFLGSSFVPTALHQDIEYISMLINRTPEIVQLGSDFEQDLVKMRIIAGLGPASAQLVRVVLAEWTAALPDGLVGERDASRCHQFLHITIAEGESILEPHGSKPSSSLATPTSMLHTVISAW